MRWLILLLQFFHVLHAIQYYSEGGPQSIVDLDDQKYVPDELVDGDQIFYPPDGFLNNVNFLGNMDLQQRPTVPNAPIKQMELVKPITEKLDKTETIPQKKGQSEFVELIEPKPNMQEKDIQYFEKRVPAYQSRLRSLVSNNMLILGIGIACATATVVGVVGGTLYYHTFRASKMAAEKFDFTHYAPAGPGKEKKKRGDEGLAYKAQLHHYQQTKQKIISGDEQLPEIAGPEDASDVSDDEDGNNFSVYECPGLAPTGDIEVQNPNFDLRH